MISIKRIFYPKNFYSVLIPVYYTTKIFGLTPFNINNNRFRYSVPNLVFSLLFVTLLNIYTSVGLTKKRTPNVPFISRMTDTISLIISQLSLFFGIFLGCIFSNKILSIIEAIIKFDKKFRKDFGLELFGEYNKSIKYIVTCISLTVFYLMVLLVLTISVDNARFFTAEFFGELLAYTLPEIVNTLVVLQFCTLVLCIKQRFKWLNKNIVILFKNLEEKIEICNTFYSKNELKHRPLTHIISDGILQDEALETIKKNRKRHYDLCVISKHLNRVYSVQILFIVMEAFVTIIVLLYHSGRHLIDDSQTPKTYLAYCIFDIGLVVIQTVSLVITCSTTSLESRKTGSLLHNMVSLQIASKCKAELQRGISAFSLQVLHQTVEFTACNVFTINEALLHSIVGAITTYLVIVVQFEVNNAGKLKSNVA